jgi:hypothetical protein
MKLSTVVLAGLATLVVLASMQAPMAAFAASPTPKNGQAPRTPDGHPDLQGTWTNATITTLQRPEQYGERLRLTEQEAAALERAAAQRVTAGARPSDLNRDLPPAGDGVGGYNNFWIDRGSRVVEIDGEKRSSLIFDPPSGRIPPLTAERRQQFAGRALRMRNNFDGPETRPLGERCLLAFGSSSGPPMLPVLYNNHYQIVQNKDTVLILVEMVHDARIVRLNGTHLPANVRKWMGDSIGRWEGDTLIVETTNFTEKEPFQGATENRKITERFTRVAPDAIHYRVTIDDPAAFTKSWSAEYPFHRTDELIYEYACHEGNYALPGILAGARAQEKSGARPNPATSTDDAEAAK